jgi:hypothetical protein
MKLTKYEKETILNFNEGEPTASVYTFNPTLKKRLAAFSEAYPDLCRKESTPDEDGVSYVIDKSRLSIRLIAPYSKERLAAARDNARKHGFQPIKFRIPELDFQKE